MQEQRPAWGAIATNLQETTMTEPKKRAEVISAFNDAGTGERYAIGDTPLIEAGAFANYEAAGLVRAAAVKRPAPVAEKPAVKRKVSRKRSAPASTPTPPLSAEPVAAPAPGEGDASA